MQTKFEPLFNRLLIKRVDVTEQKGGIHIPQISQEVPQEAVVVAVGPGQFQDGIFVKTVCRPGDRILIGKFAGDEIVIDGEKYAVVQEPEVLGVIIIEPCTLAPAEEKSMRGVRLVTPSPNPTINVESFLRD